MTPLEGGSKRPWKRQSMTWRRAVWCVACRVLRCWASNFSTWRRIVRRRVELVDVASNFSTWRPLHIPTFPHSHIVACVREAIRAALQSSSAAPAKPCLCRLHFFAGDVESQGVRARRPAGRCSSSASGPPPWSGTTWTRL